MKTRSIIYLFLLLLLTACQQKPKTIVTPWGATLEVDGSARTDSTQEGRGHYSLKDIQEGGEMIMLTISGPDTYYDYHGRGMGIQYQMCEKLAEHLGVMVRVDICNDTTDMLKRLADGEGDIIAVPLPESQQEGSLPCAVQDGGKAWLVNGANTTLADAVNEWYKPTMLADAKKTETRMLSANHVVRHVYPSMLSAQNGTISNYDHIFRKYAPTAGVDWTFMAAQCYQESCFDPKARSFAGACGLMQIMPSTADHLGLPRSQMHEPEPNIAAAARYMREMQQHFGDVSNSQERLKFALAAYNAGPGHVRDAMELTKKHGGVWQRWSDVKPYILALSKPEYYRDPVVRHGYMRGSETANYVDVIFARWESYREAIRTGKAVVSKVPVAPIPSTSTMDAPIDDGPHRAKKKNKWRE